MKIILTHKFHITTWVVTSVLFFILLYTGKPAELFTKTAAATLFWMAVYYFFLIYLAPTLLLIKKPAFFIILPAGL